jgi:hypothetical protein
LSFLRLSTFELKAFSYQFPIIFIIPIRQLISIYLSGSSLLIPGKLCALKLYQTNITM